MYNNVAIKYKKEDNKIIRQQKELKQQCVGYLVLKSNKCADLIFTGRLLQSVGPTTQKALFRPWNS